MGYSISDFTDLHTVLENNFRRETMGYVLESINDAIKLPGTDTTLFAVIIHNPRKHIELDKYLKQNFFHLHKSTGIRFLFFTIVPPPAEWINEMMNNNLFFNEPPYPGFNDRNGDTQSFDLDDSIGMLSATFEFFIGNDPLVFLFRSLKDKSILTFKTNENIIDQQFSILSDISNIPRLVGDIEKIHNKLIHQEVFKFSVSRRNYAESVMKSLKRVTRDIKYKMGSQDNQHLVGKIEKDLKKLKAAILEIKQNLQIVIESSDFIDEIELNNLYRMNEIISQLHLAFSKRTFNARKEVLYIQLESFFDEKSLSFIETALKFEQMLENQGEAISSDELDYSGITLGYAKAFELELNLSFNHFFRAKKEIELPEYFFKHQPNHDAVYRIGRDEQRPYFIDVNKRNDYPSDQDQNWLALELGRSKVVAMHVSGFENHYTKVPEEIDDMFGDRLLRFLEIWEDIKIIRNNSAHPSRIGWDQVQKIKKDYAELLDMGIFEVLCGLKKKYRGE
jgi:hypothetical protein